MIATVSLHPQRRRRNHPIPAAVSTAPSSRKRIPTVPPTGASCLYAVGLKAQTRLRTVLRHSKVVAARLAIDAPKNKKTPIAVNPGVVGRTARSRLVRCFAPAQYKPTLQLVIGLLAPRNLDPLRIFYATSVAMALATRRRNHAQRRDDYSLCGGSRVLRDLHFWFPRRPETTKKQVISSPETYWELLRVGK